MKLLPETLLQITVCDWLKVATDLPYFHFVNEGKRTYQNALILKRMGMKPGVSDLFIPRSTGECKGLWIELKAGKNKPTKTQFDFMELMRKEGYATEICYRADEAIEVIKRYYII